MSQTTNQTCVVTGPRGFVGNCLRSYLESQGWHVLEWTRQPEADSNSVVFQLGQEVPPRALAGVRALVHCAYDFGPLKWQDIVSTNVSGSEKLLRAAREAGVDRTVFISSLSAFDGCRSLYGKAKLEIERVALSLGMHVIRPGLVYGNSSGGMFGRLVTQASASRLVPMLAGCPQTQYLVHADDLGSLIQGCLMGKVGAVREPISAAHEQPVELKQILIQISAVLDRKLSFVPVPWQFVWLALKTLESLGRPARFRSDSLISMVYQDPSPSFSLIKSLGFQCRPFAVTREMVRA